MATTYSPFLSLSDLTPEYVRKHYLTGLTLLGADDEELSDDWYSEHIANAIAQVEEYTNVDIIQRVNEGEKHDFVNTDYAYYAFLQLFRFPTLSVQSVKAVYPTQTVVQVFPTEWTRVDITHSQLHLVPTIGTLAQVLIGQGADIVPLISSQSYLPHLWQVDYVSGFDTDKIPRVVMSAICKLAAIEMLKVMSDTVTPLGQTSSSLSIDSMSQSKSYNLPAFKARIDTYSSDLGLPQQGAPMSSSGLLGQIKQTYRGIVLASV